ncbi:hypothetical protein PF010_g30803, partial [Phytophthora fragariae]
EPASPAASTTSTLILENDEDEATATSVQDDSVRATDSGNTNADTAAPSPIPRGRVADPIPRRRSKRAKNPTKRAVESRLQSRKRPRALRMMQSDDSFCALPDESKATILLMQDKGFTRGYIGVGKESGSAREQPPVREATVLIPTNVESSASEDDMNQDSGTDNGETSSELALASSAAIHLDTLEFPQGAYGQGPTVYRKTWHSYFFVLLVRKSSLGMFASQAEHLAGSEPHAAVFKLRYTLRIRPQPKRPHQFRLTHSSKGGGSPKKPLHFAASSLDEMNGWIAALIKAIAVIDELERVAAEERLNKQTESESATQE